MKDCDMQMSVEADSKEEALDKLVMHAKTHAEKDHTDLKMSDEEMRDMIASDMHSHDKDDSEHMHKSM